MDKENNCFLCNNEFSAGETVAVTRGIITIRNSSVQPDDGIADRMAGLRSIVVHRECCKDYTRQSSIVSLLRRSAKKHTILRLSLSPFNFK